MITVCIHNVNRNIINLTDSMHSTILHKNETSAVPEKIITKSSDLSIKPTVTKKTINYKDSISSKSTAIKATTKRPIMILHIGPRKTASTTLQVSLGNSRDALLKDNFIYIRKEDICFMSLFTVKCSTRFNFNNAFFKYLKNKFNLDITPNKSLSNDNIFLNGIETLRKNGINIVLSSEEAAYRIKTSTNYNKLQKLTNGWDVRVVVTYRRYFDWLLSDYDQNCNRFRGINLNISTFNDYYDSSIFHHKNLMYAPLDMTLYDRWKSYYNNVYVFNMYSDNTNNSNTNNDDDDDPIYTRFICQSIPEAQHTCDALKNGSLIIPSKTKQANTATSKISATALLITIILNGQGDIDFDNKNYKYFKAAKIIDKYLLDHHYTKVDIMNSYNATNARNRNVKKQKITCLRKEYVVDILRKSIDIEKKLLSKFHYSSKNSNGETALKPLFKQYWKEKRFCQLDVPTFLNENKDDLLSYLKTSDFVN